MDWKGGPTDWAHTSVGEKPPTVGGGPAGEDDFDPVWIGVAAGGSGADLGREEGESSGDEQELHGGLA